MHDGSDDQPDITVLRSLPSDGELHAEWLAAMRAGDFAPAWRISDIVLRRRAGLPCGHLPHHLRWVWDGTPLAGRRVLVRCYHGLGDTLQFIRFVPRLATMARGVIVEAQPSLLQLLSSIREIDTLVPLDAAPPPFDVAVESMELAHALRVTLATLPASVPYLWPRRKMGSSPSHAPHDRLRVGLAWHGGAWRPERFLPLAALEPLLALPADFVSLQLGDARPLGDARFVATLDETASIIDTAGLMLDLDLIITVDTMTAHLAGALGRPVWVLLDSDPDWRWMQGRMDSPWYPTMRLFRQEGADTLDELVRRVGAALAQLTAPEHSPEACSCPGYAGEPHVF